MNISINDMNVLEKHFDYMELKDKNNLYLETWTNGGVDMIIYLDADKSIKENLEQYINNFDIDEEIDLYRQDKRYKGNFTITESVDDFRNWIKYIDIVKNELKGE